MVIITDHKCAYKKMLEINTDHKNHLISPFHRWMNHHYAAMPVFFGPFCLLARRSCCKLCSKNCPVSESNALVASSRIKSSWSEAFHGASRVSFSQGGFPVRTR